MHSLGKSQLLRLRFTALLSVAALTLTHSGRANPPQPYDEIRDSNGNVRPHYAEVYSAFKNLDSGQHQTFKQWSKKEFLGDQALDPLPRLLTQQEAEELRKGVQQRATAIRMFLEDYYSNGNQWHQVVPPKVLEKIIQRSGETRFKGLVNPKNITFPYGPDIIRDPAGRWRVLEDNPGYIGGLGDLMKGREILLKGIPGYREVLNPLDQPESYFQQLAAHYRGMARPQGGSVLVLGYSFDEIADNEDFRLKEIYEKLGFEYFPVDEKRRLLVVEKDGVWIHSRNRYTKTWSKKPVGYVVFNGDHRFLDEKFFRNKNQQEDSILKAVLDGRVGSNYSPGIDFIGDKEFTTYVDDLVRLYTKEEPILTGVTTQRFADNPELIEKVFSNKDQWVVKQVDGRGGKGIWVGAKISENEFLDAKKEVKRYPDQYLAQEYTPLSLVEDNLVDLRLMAQVSPQGVIVADTPWGRAISKNGDGKVNISSNGFESPVVVVKSPANGASRAKSPSKSNTQGCLSRAVQLLPPAEL